MSLKYRNRGPRLTRASLPMPFSILAVEPPKMESRFSANMMFISSECGLRTFRASTETGPPPPETEFGVPLLPTDTETC